MRTLFNFTYSDNGDPELHYRLDIDFRVKGRRGTVHPADINPPDSPEVEITRLAILSCEVELGGTGHPVWPGEHGWSKRHIRDLMWALEDDERFIELALMQRDAA